MANPKKKTPSQEVDAYIKQLKNADYAKILQALRKIILSVDSEIAEHIKWNVPAFYYSGEMKASDPKEYLRDLIVSNTRQKDHVLLVFPSGAKVIDKSGLLEGDYKDGRRLAKFHSVKEVKEKEKALKKIISDWMKLIER